MPIGFTREQCQNILDTHIKKLSIFKVDHIGESGLLDMCVELERGMTIEYVRKKYKLFYNI